MSEFCATLHLLSNTRHRFRFPFDDHDLPLNGIYILFEVGEYAHGADRIVRVGTHTGDNRLRARLCEHYVKENKDRSIFRKNIGRALLSQAGDAFLEQWNWSLTKREDKIKYESLLDARKQIEIERQVTDYIRAHFSFAVFAISGRSRRQSLESKIISTVSCCGECRPSSHWLGLSSPISGIRESGLWQVAHLYGESLSADELRILRSA